MITKQYSPQHVQAFTRWRTAGFNSVTLTESDVELIEREDFEAGVQIRRERLAANIKAIDAAKAEEEAAAKAAVKAVPPRPARKPRKERLANRAMPPLPAVSHWRSIADPGFEAAFRRATSIWLKHPDQLTEHDVSALATVDAKYAESALKARVAPLPDDYDWTSSLERDLLVSRDANRALFVNFAIARLRHMQLEARISQLEAGAPLPCAPVSTNTDVSGALGSVELRLRALEAATPIRWTGTWSTGTKYKSSELATWDGACWIAVRDNAGSEPGKQTDGPWRIFAMRGKQGSAATCRCSGEKR